MNSQDIRQGFIDFFRDRGHQVVASAPLVPHGDPTLLFTNAGMVPFKNSFLGLEPPPHPRTVSVQKCLRVSGKHNDLENVGPSPRHHTFFEMLGNFSFGDYFKEEAIELAWQLVTEAWGLPVERLFATVYEEDDDAAALWAKISTLPAERILRCGAADNFWSMGDTGPCGPSSEIFVDLRPGEPQVDWQDGCDSGRYLEIWNLVFMQLDRDASGRTTPLPNPSIDTGAGLERVAAVLQGVSSNYDSDVFQPLLRAAADLAGRRYGAADDDDVSLRVIADHLRATAFLLADGVIPGPDGRGYVLRRLIRRAVRHGMRLDFEEPFLHRLVGTLEHNMGRHYEELRQTRAASETTLREEEEKYLTTLASGARRIQEAIDRSRQRGDTRLPGHEIFALYDTYGQELDSVREIAQEEKLELDLAGFESLMTERRQQARAATGELQQRLTALHEALHGDGELGETEFFGYENLHLDEARILRLATIAPATARDTLATGERGVAVLDKTVFYAESGGQVGDVGRFVWEGGEAQVFDTQKDSSGARYHLLEVTRGSLRRSALVDLELDRQHRLAVERNHTATHLLHAALRQVLGDGVRQAGSLVAADRLRFDFTFHRPLQADELSHVEELVNGWIRKSRQTGISWQSYQQALDAGAMALFGEKYGDRVRTVEIPGTSLELCGGCHVRNSGEIGLFLFTGERGVASGVRRVEAITGRDAFAKVRARDRLLGEVSERLAVPPEKAPQEVLDLKEKLKKLEAELAKLRLAMVSGNTTTSSEATEVGGVRVTAREVPTAPANELRQMADKLRDQQGSGIVILATREDGKVQVVVAVSKDLTSRLSAGSLIKQLAAMVGGGGGGRPDFAQAGGRQPDKLPEMLAAAPQVIAEQLAH